VLIPSIDLQGGRIVQLVQGERLAVESTDMDGWIARFTGHSKVQVIDLDAAKGTGANDELVARVCAALPCRVGGGIRTIERAQGTIGLGATKVILGSALFRAGTVDAAFAAAVSAELGPERLIAAVDSRRGRVVINGWRTALDITPIDAIRQLEPFFSEFLYTHVDREGLMQGTDIETITAIRRSTTRAITAAGGITTREEIDALDALGVDAVVGMAIYTGRLDPDAGTKQ